MRSRNLCSTVERIFQAKARSDPNSSQSSFSQMSVVCRVLAKICGLTATPPVRYALWPTDEALFRCGMLGAISALAIDPFLDHLRGAGTLAIEADLTGAPAAFACASSGLQFTSLAKPGSRNGRMEASGLKKPSAAAMPPWAIASPALIPITGCAQGPVRVIGARSRITWKFLGLP